MLSRYLKELCSIATQLFPASMIEAQKKRLAYSLQEESPLPETLIAKLPVVSPHHDLPLLIALLAAPIPTKQKPVWNSILGQLVNGLNTLQGLLVRYPDELSNWRLAIEADGVTNETGTAHHAFRDKLKSVFFGKSKETIGIHAALIALSDLLATNSTYQHQVAMLQAFQAKFTPAELNSTIAKYFIDIERYADNLTEVKATKDIAQKIMSTLQENMQTLALKMDALTGPQNLMTRDAIHQRELKELRRQIGEMGLKQAAMTAQHKQVVGTLVSEITQRDNAIQALEKESEARSAADMSKLAIILEDHAKKVVELESAQSELRGRHQELQEKDSFLGDQSERLTALEQTYKTTKASLESANVENRKLSNEVQRSRKIVSETLRRAFCLDVTLNEEHFKKKSQECLNKFRRQMPATPDKSFIPKAVASDVFNGSMTEAEEVLGRKDAIRALELYISAYKIAGKQAPKQKKKTGLFTPTKKSIVLSQHDIARNKIIDLFKRYFASMPTKKGLATRLDAEYTWRLGDCLNILVQLPRGIDAVFDLGLYPDVLFNLLEHAIDKLEKGSRKVKPDQVINLYRWTVEKIATLYIDSEGFDSLSDMESTLQEDYLIADYVARLDIVLEKLTNIDSAPSPAQTYHGLLSKPATKRALPVRPDVKPTKTNKTEAALPDVQVMTDDEPVTDVSRSPSPVSVQSIAAPHDEPSIDMTNHTSTDQQKSSTPEKINRSIDDKQPRKQTVAVNEPSTPTHNKHPVSIVAAAVAVPPPMPPPLPKPIKTAIPTAPATPFASAKDSHSQPMKPNNAPSTPLQNKHLAAIRAGVMLSKAEFISPSKRPRKPTGNAHAVALMNKINEFAQHRESDMRLQMSKRYEAMHDSDSDSENSGWDSDNDSANSKFESTRKS